jgi:hypothetical protein
MVLLSLGCTRESDIIPGRVVLVGCSAGISDAITEAMAEKALRIAPEPHRSVYRDSDIIPAIPAADILKRRLDKRESHAITGLETGDQMQGDLFSGWAWIRLALKHLCCDRSAGAGLVLNTPSG